METRQAQQAVTVAVAWGMAMLGCNVLCTLLLFFADGRVPLNPGVHIPWNPFYQLGNTLLSAALVFGLYKRSLLCPVVLILITVGRTVYLLMITGRLTLLLLPVISVVLYIPGLPRNHVAEATGDRRGLFLSRETSGHRMSRVGVVKKPPYGRVPSWTPGTGPCG